MPIISCYPIPPRAEKRPLPRLCGWINPAQSDTFCWVLQVVLTTRNSQTILDKIVGTLCHVILESQFSSLHETPAPPSNVAQKDWMYAVNRITVVNIVKGSGVSQLILSKIVWVLSEQFTKTNSIEKWFIFGTDLFRKLFLEVCKVWGF